MDIKRILLAIVTFALGAVLLVFIWRDIQADRAWSQAKERAEVEARQYEIRIQEIEAEIASSEQKAEVTQEKGAAVIAYQLSSPDDVPFMVAQGENYGFKPTAVLDCAKSEEELRLMAEALQAAGNPADIMLTGTPFSEEILANARMLLAELPSYGYTGGVSFLLRKADDTEENRALILDEAFAGYAFYESNGVSGTLPSGTPFLSYSFMRMMESSIDPILDTIEGGKISMVFVLDLESVVNGTLTLDKIVEWAQTIAADGESGGINIYSADKAFGELRTIRAENDEARQEYEDYKAEKLNEIAELRQKIEDIKK